MTDSVRISSPEQINSFPSTWRRVRMQALRVMWFLPCQTFHRVITIAPPRGKQLRQVLTGTGYPLVPPCVPGLSVREVRGLRRWLWTVMRIVMKTWSWTVETALNTQILRIMCHLNGHKKIWKIWLLTFPNELLPLSLVLLWYKVYVTWYNCCLANEKEHYTFITLYSPTAPVGHPIFKGHPLVLGEYCGSVKSVEAAWWWMRSELARRNGV